jgi:hypothetical protein
LLLELSETFSLKNNNNKIFFIEKDKERMMTLSKKMRMKAEKAKMLLGEKTNRKENINKEYFVTNDNKVIPLTMYPDKLSAKEIRMLRNRISAQESRDRRKAEFEKLKEISDNLMNDNIELKRKLEEKENEFNKFINNTALLCCKKCKEKIFNDNINSNISSGGNKYFKYIF